MRYQTEYFANPNTITYHVDQLVTTKFLDSFWLISHETEDVPVFVRKIMCIDGVALVSLFKNEICIFKTRQSPWEDLCSQIELVLKSDFANDHVLSVVPKVKPFQTEEITRNDIDADGQC